jgi:hypothetical protein
MQNHPKEHGMSPDESAVGSETMGVVTYPSDIMSAGWIRSKDRDNAATHTSDGISTGASMSRSESTTVAALTETWGIARNDGYADSKAWSETADNSGTSETLDKTTKTRYDSPMGESNGRSRRTGRVTKRSESDASGFFKETVVSHDTGMAHTICRSVPDDDEWKPALGKTKEPEAMSFTFTIASPNEITIAADSRSTTILTAKNGETRHIHDDRYQKIAFRGDVAVASTGSNDFGGKNLREIVGMCGADTPKGVIAELDGLCRELLATGKEACFVVAGHENGELDLWTAKFGKDNTDAPKHRLTDDKAVVFYSTGIKKGCDFVDSFNFDTYLLGCDQAGAAIGTLKIVMGISALSVFASRKDDDPPDTPCSVGGDTVCVSMRKGGGWKFVTPKPPYYEDLR